MALTTARARASALGVGLAVTLLIPPSGAVSQPDRQTVGLSYSEIKASIPIIITPDCYLVLSGVIGFESIGITGILDGEGAYDNGIIYPFTALAGSIDGSDTALVGAIDPEGLYTEGQIQEYLSINAPLCD